MDTVKIYYSHDAGWGFHPSAGVYTVEVPADVTECYVVGLLCILTGKLKWAKYCENHPEDDKPIVPEIVTWCRR